MQNKGLAYEQKIKQMLINNGKLTAEGLSQVTSSGNDAGFTHDGKFYFLEVKNKSAPDYGSKKIIYRPKYKRWEWNVADRDPMTMVFNKFGILSKIDKFTPNKYVLMDYQIQEKHKREDMKNFEKKLGKEDISGASLLHQYYSEKECFYIQIEGKGFYHLAKDPANLGVPQFMPGIVIRLRAKPHSSLPYHNYSFRAVITASRRTFGGSTFDLDRSMDFL